MTLIEHLTEEDVREMARVIHHVSQNWNVVNEFCPCCGERWHDGTQCDLSECDARLDAIEASAGEEVKP